MSATKFAPFPLGADLTRYREAIDTLNRRLLFAHERMLSGLEARYYVQGAHTTDAVEVCRSIRRARWMMDLTDAEVVRLQVAAMSGAAGAWNYLRRTP